MAIFDLPFDPRFAQKARARFEIFLRGLEKNFQQPAGD
jgi:hypothetical protein